MTLSGTEVFFLYILFYRLACKHFSVYWRYFILKVSTIFYLIPVALFKFIVLDKFYRLFPSIESNLDSRIRHIDINKYILLTNDFKSVSWQILTVWLIIIFTGVISFLIVYIQFHGYFKLKKSCLTWKVSNSLKEIEMFQRVKSELGIKTEVKLMYSDLCDSPFTIGVFHPTVVIPSAFKKLHETDYCYILKHELNHVKNHDILLKFIALLSIAINWYNPFCYFMYRELCNVSELYCDFCTTKNLDLAQRKRYCHLIVNIATENKRKFTKKYVVSLVNNDSKTIERRILELKNHGKPKKLFLSCLVGGVICISGSITSLAYNPPVIYDTPRVTDSTMKIMVFKDAPVQLKDALPYDYFWTDKYGNMHEIKESEEKAYCPHDYESVTISRHSRYSNNSCKMVYVDGEMCNICGAIIEGNVINTVRYDVCPH